MGDQLLISEEEGVADAQSVGKEEEEERQVLRRASRWLALRIEVFPPSLLRAALFVSFLHVSLPLLWENDMFASRRSQRMLFA